MLRDRRAGLRKPRRFWKWPGESGESPRSAFSPAGKDIHVYLRHFPTGCWGNNAGVRRCGMKIAITTQALPGSGAGGSGGRGIRRRDLWRYAWAHGGLRGDDPFGAAFKPLPSPRLLHTTGTMRLLRSAAAAGTVMDGREMSRPGNRCVPWLGLVCVLPARTLLGQRGKRHTKRAEGGSFRGKAVYGARRCDRWRRYAQVGQPDAEFLSIYVRRCGQPLRIRTHYKIRCLRPYALGSDAAPKIRKAQDFSLMGIRWNPCVRTRLPKSSGAGLAYSAAKVRIEANFMPYCIAAGQGPAYGEAGALCSSRRSAVIPEYTD